MTIASLAMTLAGPVLSFAARRLPGLDRLRSAAFAIAALAAVGAIAWGVWTVNEWIEDRRAAKAAHSIVDAANAKAEAKALKHAVAEQQETLRRREDSLAGAEARLADLEQQLKEARDASPDPDTIVVPAGDPWLERGVRRRR